MNTVRLRFFATRVEIWFLQSIVLSLTKPLGLLTTLQISVISSSVRLARIYEESIPWSSTNFCAATWLKLSLKNISSICSMMIGGGLYAAGVHLPSITVTTSPPPSPHQLHRILVPLRHVVSGTSGLSWLQSSSHDKLVRFAQLVSLDLISGYQLSKGAQAVASPETQAALAEWYGQWSLIVVSNDLATFFIVDMICHATCCSQKHKSWHNHIPFCFLLWLGLTGSDKLVKYSPIFRVQWIMAMAWWLTLLECHCI